MLTATTGRKPNFLHHFFCNLIHGWVGKKALGRRRRKRAMPVAREAFYIMPHYRHFALADGVTPLRIRLAGWRQLSAGLAVRIMFIM
ncbi:hypothetical protein SAMN05443429_10210 [Cruoricaptor ignavus]|uniref:Uncharacterized protein n=1 Tax=Cruoricaptor ignavus TaxID=1118202 RepID=A0A1M6BI86_9FLAO|nr:hypothetical protein SAMN05443429_10210 [Cruoricaptor ignavus]